MLEQRIQSLVDNRTIELARKDLSKKFYTIVQAFGKPIIEQSISYSMLPDFWELEPPDMIHEIGDDNIYLRGYYFNGLSRGTNITIKVLTYDGKITSLTVNYNGYKVFEEMEGELQCYVPFESWESKIEDLYTYAKPAEQEKLKQQQEEQKEKNKKRTITILDRIKSLWGVS